MSFDLNIDNYTRDELIQMFDLPSNFDKNIFEVKETKLRESIVNNTEINKNYNLDKYNITPNYDWSTINDKNYDYLFWSILAAGTVLVTMNIVKKQ